MGTRTVVTLVSFLILFYSAPTPSQAEGDTCADPVLVGGVPYSDARTTCAYSDDYQEACFAGDSSPDVVYEFTPTVDMCVDVQLCDSFVGFNFKLYVYSEDAGCPALDAGDTGLDIACDDDGCAPHPQILGLPLEVLKTYWFVVDSPGENVCGTYQFEITPCAGPPELVFNRGIDDLTLLPAGGELWRAEIRWYAEADSTPTMINFDFDLVVTVNDEVVQVIPEDLFFQPRPIDYPCRTAPCSLDECGDYFWFGGQRTATCLTLRLDGEEECLCSVLLTSSTQPLQLAQGDVVRARIVPAQGAIPEQILTDDVAVATCCPPPTANEPTSWGEIKGIYR